MIRPAPNAGGKNAETSTQVQRYRLVFKNAYYIKLGRNGIWETSSIDNDIARIGWSTTPLKEIIANNWTSI